MNYSYFYFEEIKDTTTLSYDVFISAFDGCDRTSQTFNNVVCEKKKWIVFPQYCFYSEQLPDHYLTSSYLSESDFIMDIFDELELAPGMSICIDCTGFIIPYLVFLIQAIKRKGINTFYIIYSEPDSYINAEKTVFTVAENETRPIEGYSAVEHIVDGNEVLIVFAGYNDSLITNVTRAKSKASSKYIFVGFPSLQADMYQQNLLQVYKAKETIGETNISYLKAPAYDPFVAAQKVQNIINTVIKKSDHRCVFHIAPLSTKPMAVASALVYLYNPDIPIDVIYPPADEYKSGHAKGIKRTWQYKIEF